MKTNLSAKAAAAQAVEAACIAKMVADHEAFRQRFNAIRNSSRVRDAEIDNQFDEAIQPALKAWREAEARARHAILSAIIPNLDDFEEALADELQNLSQSEQESRKKSQSELAEIRDATDLRRRFLEELYRTPVDASLQAEGEAFAELNESEKRLREDCERKHRRRIQIARAIFGKTSVQHREAYEAALETLHKKISEAVKPFADALTTIAAEAAAVRDEAKRQNKKVTREAYSVYEKDSEEARMHRVNAYRRLLEELDKLTVETSIA